MSRTTYKYAKKNTKSQFSSLINIKNNIHVIIIFSILIIGIVTGIVISQRLSEQNINTISALADSFINVRAENSFSAIFSNSFLSTFILLIILFISGFCAVGTPVSIIVMFINALGFGIYSGYLYSSMGIQGFMYNLCLVFPGVFIGFIILSFGTEFSTKMSTNLFSSIFHSSKNDKIVSNSKLYCMKFLFLSGTIFIKAVLESILTTLFIGFF